MTLTLEQEEYIINSDWGNLNKIVKDVKSNKKEVSKIILREINIKINDLMEKRSSAINEIRSVLALFVRYYQNIDSMDKLGLLTNENISGFKVSGLTSNEMKTLQYWFDTIISYENDIRELNNKKLEFNTKKSTKKFS